MTLLPLKELVVHKPRPVTTLALTPAFRDHAEEMVDAYIFTDTLRHHFTRILESVATGRGQGFWVQAEYGAGKTHFLVTLAALLAGRTPAIWSAVRDEEVRHYQRRLQETRLFPVIVSLRGMGGADTFSARSLLDVLLEDGFVPALGETGLAGEIWVLAADDYIRWFTQQTSAALRNDIETHIRRATGQEWQSYQEEEGANALAHLIAGYCQQHAIDPKIAASARDRFDHIYRQLVHESKSRYDGLLIVIDEYEGWEKAQQNPAARAFDEDVLETLAYLLPLDLGLRVYTVVASQSAAPAKLRGGQAGDRFINIPLLATTNERDYDVIVSRRVRGLNPHRAPELSDHFRYYREHFHFANGLSEQEFADIFPFQPRCFEVVRHLTARDLPTTRSGLAIFYEVVNDAELLDRDLLIRVADLLRSPHLGDCLATPVYREAYNAYKVAKEALPTLDIDESDRPLAAALLDTLFLWYLAYLERPRPLSLKELAEATLTTADFLRAEDNVAYVLGQMQSLRQVQVDDQQALFVAAGGEGVSVVTLFQEYRRRAQSDGHQVSALWSQSLFFTQQETRGLPGLFANFTCDEPANRRFEHRNLEYAGQVVIASRWQPDWGWALPTDDSHFRIVILTADAAQTVAPQELRDPRILVIHPASLSDEARRAAADYLAWRMMSQEYAEEKRSGKEAEAVREWLAGQQGALLNNLVQTHLRQYQNGTVISKADLAISLREAFGLPSEDRRLATLVERLLTAAYPQLPLDPHKLRGPLRSAEIVRIFNGYFSRTPGTADTAATRNFGAPLGLSHPDRPHHFAPQNVKTLELIAEFLEERKGELPIYLLYDRLSSPPYGLPYPLIQLYLFAFIRRGDPRTELLLKPDHRLRGQNRQPFAGNRVTASNLIDLDFRPGLERSFDLLIYAAGPAWNDVVAYARELLGELHAATDPAEVERQARRLDHALADLAADLKTTHDNLQRLARTLDTTVPAPARTTLERLAALSATAEPGYQTFYEQATSLFATPDDLRESQRTAAQLKELAQRAAEVMQVKSYLDAVKLRPADRDLLNDRLALLGRLNLEGLAHQPGLWGSIADAFGRFQERYRSAYQIHHRDLQTARQQLQETLAAAPRRLEALRLLNSIPELGAPVGEELVQRHQRLLDQLQTCPVPVGELRLDVQTTCTRCHLTLLDEAPHVEVERFGRDLERSLHDQQRRLASEAVRRVLARSNEDVIQKFVQVVQTANLGALVDVMSEDLVTFIRVLLEEADTAAVKSDLLNRFTLAYPTLEEADLPAAVQAFERLLRTAFAEAHQANPGKKTVRLTLR